MAWDKQNDNVILSYTVCTLDLLSHPQCEQWLPRIHVWINDVVEAHAHCNLLLATQLLNNVPIKRETFFPSILRKCIMTVQLVKSEIAEMATSLLFKADLGCHPHAGATGGTGSLFFVSLFHIHYTVSCFSYAAENNCSRIGSALQTVISNCNSPHVSTFHCPIPS